MLLISGRFIFFESNIWKVYLVIIISFNLLPFLFDMYWLLNTCVVPLPRGCPIDIHLLRQSLIDQQLVAYHYIPKIS